MNYLGRYLLITIKLGTYSETVAYSIKVLIDMWDGTVPSLYQRNMSSEAHRQSLQS